MKPRNDFERELQHYIDSGKVTEPTAKQMEQAYKIITKDLRYKYYIFNTTQTINGMTLTKCYKAHRCDKGNKMIMFCLCLIKAERNGMTAWAGRGTYLGYVDSFSHNGDVTIKGQQRWYNDYVNDNWLLQSRGKADPYAVAYHYNHNGYYFHDSHMETLAKSRNAYDYQLFEHLVQIQEKPISSHIWQAYKIAKRHGYNFQGDMYRWIYYINLLRINKRDWHNPAIICPTNLVQATNTMIDTNDKRMQAIAEARRERLRREHEQWLIEHADELEAQERERIRRQEAARKADERAKKTYATRLKKWLGIVLVADDLIIRPLQSVDEFKAEGEAMHHCVYACGYYKKANTLILSARDSAGKRLATIEFNTKTKKIVQCRAACNAEPARYKEICALVMDGIIGKTKRAAA